MQKIIQSINGYDNIFGKLDDEHSLELPVTEEEELEMK